LTGRFVVRNGVGLDDFLDKLCLGQRRHDGQLVLGDGIPTITVSGEANPHFWLDRASSCGTTSRRHRQAVRARFHPARRAMRQREGVRQHADGARRRLMPRSGIPRRTQARDFHDAFRTSRRHYGFELVGVISPTRPGTLAGELAALIETSSAPA